MYNWQIALFKPFYFTINNLLFLQLSKVYSSLIAQYIASIFAFLFVHSSKYTLAMFSINNLLYTMPYSKLRNEHSVIGVNRWCYFWTFTWIFKLSFDLIYRKLRMIKLISISKNILKKEIIACLYCLYYVYILNKKSLIKKKNCIIRRIKFCNCRSFIM